MNLEFQDKASALMLQAVSPNSNSIELDSSKQTKARRLMVSSEIKVCDLDPHPEQINEKSHFRFSENDHRPTIDSKINLDTVVEIPNNDPPPGIKSENAIALTTRFNLTYSKQNPPLTNTKTQKTSIMEKFRSIERENLDEVRFKPEVFAEMFIWHVLFYFFLGPFMILLKLIPKVNTNVLRNQQFLGKSSLFQVVQWVLLMTAISLYIVDSIRESGTKYFYTMEVFDLFLIMAVRMSFISCKYAFSTPKFLKIFRSQAIPDEQINHQLLLIVFLEGQKLETVHEQLQESLLRLRVDTSIFYFTFLGHDPCNADQEKFTKRRTLKRVTRLLNNKKTKGRSETIISAQDVNNFSPDMNNFSPDMNVLSEVTFNDFLNLMSKPHQLEKEMLPGYAFAFEIVLQSRVLMRRLIITLGLLFGATRAVLPTIARLIEKDPAIGNSRIEHAIIISSMLSTFFIFTINYLLLSVSLVDLRFKLKLLSQVTYLLPSYMGRDAGRVIPPLNIFNPVSLKSWETFREVLLDYGNRYQARHSFNLTISLTVYLTEFAIILLILLKIINVDVDLGDSLIVCYEVTILMGLFLTLLIRGAQINDYFGIHRSRLLHVKRVFSNMLAMKKFYFESQECETDNQLIKEGINYFRKIFDCEGDAFVEKCTERLELLEMTVSNMIENLDASSVDNPFTIFGFRITWQTIKALGAGAVSVGVAIYQVRYNSSF